METTIKSWDNRTSNASSHFALEALMMRLPLESDIAPRGLLLLHLRAARNNTYCNLVLLYREWGNECRYPSGGYVNVGSA